MAASLARDLHPGAWWLWALGLAATASSTTNPLILLLIIAIAGFVVTMRRSDHGWSGAFRLYLLLGVAIVLIRVAFRIILPTGYPGHVVFTLPEIPLPDWVLGVHLLGAVTREGLLAGVYDGLRLATLVICVGAANSLANPKRLLKSMPPALYEIGTAVVVSVSMLPQLADSVRRVRAARALRGISGNRIGRLRGVVVPVLEDALERSIALAAGMDARGYGRSGSVSRGQRWRTGALMLAGLCGICVGTYALLDKTAPRFLALPMLGLGVLVALAGFVSAGQRVERSRYRPDRWQAPEILVAASGLTVAVLTFTVLHDHYVLLYPDVTRMPTITMTALLSVLLGVLPAVLAPRPRLTIDTASPDELEAGAA